MNHHRRINVSESSLSGHLYFSNWGGEDYPLIFTISGILARQVTVL